MSIQFFHESLDTIRIPSARMYGGQVVPTGAWRSVDQFTRAYGEQCFIDEMATALKRDPLDLRLELYQDNKSALSVLNLLLKKQIGGNPCQALMGVV